jgi:hypothetical protein
MVASKRAYGLSTPFIDIFPEPITRTSAPTTSEKNFPNGFVWIYQNGDTRTAYVYGGLDSSGDAVWILAGPGSSDVDTLTGDSGGAISPATGNITLAGGTNITTAGAASTITFNLDAAISLATSVTSPLYTVGSTDLVIQGDAANDVKVTLGDAAGATNFIVEDSTNSALFTVPSNGGVTFSSLTVSGGAFTSSGGAISLNASSNFNTVINSGTSTGTVTIGNGSAGAITVDSGAGISIDGATASNFTVTGASEDLTLASSGGSVNITASESAADAIVINASGAAGGVQVQAGTGGILIGNEADTTTIDVGDIAPTASRTITIGGGTVVTASVTDTIDIGPDGATTNADSVKTVNVNTGGVTTGQVLTNIASGAITSGTHTVSIQTGNAAAGTVATNISTGTGTKTVSLGNADANTTFNVDAITLINDSVNANTSINTGTSTGTVSIGNAAAGAIAVDTAAGISLDAATASNFTVTGAADLTLTSSAGSIPITAGEADAAAIALQAASGGLDIDTGLAIIADAAGNIELNSSAGQILIGNDDVDQNASFATDGERTVTVGSTNGAAGLVLQAGTGEITMTGTVKEISAELVGWSGVSVPAFTMDACAVLGTNAGGAPVGTTGAVNNLVLQGGSIMQEFVIGAGQTIIQPVMGANGLIISGDETNTEGYEYNIPYLQYTIGTSAAFFFELGLYINDMDGADPYVFGFRKTEANNATFGNYTDYATMGMIASSSVTNVVLATELNSGGQTVTDTTDAWGGDGSTNTLKVLVDASGNVTYTINGAAPSATAAFQFDNTDVVIPFIRITHSASPTDVAITSMRIGFQA